MSCTHTPQKEEDGRDRRNFEIENKLLHEYSVKGDSMYDTHKEGRLGEGYLDKHEIRMRMEEDCLTTERPKKMPWAIDRGWCSWRAQVRSGC